jgi:hypothetical protein
VDIHFRGADARQLLLNEIFDEKQKHRHLFRDEEETCFYFCRDTSVCFLFSLKPKKLEAIVKRLRHGDEAVDAVVVQYDPVFFISIPKDVLVHHIWTHLSFREKLSSRLVCRHLRMVGATHDECFALSKAFRVC